MRASATREGAEAAHEGEAARSTSPEVPEEAGTDLIRLSQDPQARTPTSPGGKALLQHTTTPLAFQLSSPSNHVLIKAEQRSLIPLKQRLLHPPASELPLPLKTSKAKEEPIHLQVPYVPTTILLATTAKGVRAAAAEVSEAEEDLAVVAEEEVMDLLQAVMEAQVTQEDQTAIEEEAEVFLPTMEEAVAVTLHQEGTTVGTMPLRHPTGI